MPSISVSTWNTLCERVPGIAVTPEAFELFLQSKQASESTLAPERLFELFLSFACSISDPKALKAFEEQYGPIVEGVRKRFGPRAPEQRELWADIQQHLFAPRETEAELRIAGYSGQAELRSWLKVVTTRYMLSRIEAQKPEDPIDDRLLEGMRIGTNTPEYQMQREESRGHFKRAFSESVAALGARERQILRLAFAEGLTIDDLGALYGTHRTTAFRNLKQASERLGAELRARLREALKLNDGEYDRWCESLRSGIDLSVHRHFSEPPPGTP
jgi:RNA polymerase sigma-70 factor, ECF subfamily